MFLRKIFNRPEEDEGGGVQFQNPKSKKQTPNVRPRMRVFSTTTTTAVLLIFFSGRTQSQSFSNQIKSSQIKPGQIKFQFETEFLQWYTRGSY